ncbi:MAG: cobyric acid synthase CobQ [Archaeoglobus sp.]|nr:MAG: cobyric acid synthase CobQ [Archaeoglobus sp.]
MPALMIAGTTSSAGKSSITTALCRILSKRGYSVAPFKAQNMSLNSYVTRDGKEIAIAQAIQAKAAGIEPDERMNPVLLKPKGDFVSQLIVMGVAVGDFTFDEYCNKVPKLRKVIEKAYTDLQREFDVVVIEGAGGIAEINLYDRDLSNIGMARMAKPAIIVVGDIDRGGVFASLYGSYLLLPEDVRRAVRGFLINRLRGKADILGSGIDKLEKLTGIRVIGVVPYAESIFSEDSLCIEEWNKDGVVGIVKLSRISNFTDFEPIRKVSRFVSLSDELDGIELLIVPGSKNTIKDLNLLKSTGMDEKIKNFSKNKPVIGICGGYQMLGMKIVDHGIEHSRTTVKGLGLLDVSTEFKTFSKICRKVKKRIVGEAVVLDRIKGEEVRGYEIHKGFSYISRNPIFEIEKEFEGCASDDGLVWGTYTHALFWNENIVKALSRYLDVKIKFSSFKDRIEKFARVVEENVDIDEIVRWIN